MTIPKTETTLQVSRLTLDGTSVLLTRQCKYCTRCKNSCRTPGTNLIVFQTGSTSPTGKARQVKNRCLAQPNEVAKTDHLTNLQAVWDKLALKIMEKLITNEQPCVQLFEHASIRCLDAAKERWRSWNPFQKGVGQSSHDLEFDFWRAVNSVSFRSEIGSRTRCQFSCSAAIHWFVPWVTIFFASKDLLKDPHTWNDQKLVSFKTSSSHRIKVCCALTLMYRHRCLILHKYE